MKKILRIFPTKTNCIPQDDLAFTGKQCWPGLIKPAVDEIHISVVFDWDIEKAERIQKAWEIYYPGRVWLGGPALRTVPGEFEPGMYLRKGITITSRGCIRKCPWCLVPKREGKIRTLEIKPGNIIQDNNLLACPDEHVREVFAMLRHEKGIRFIGGLDMRLLRGWHIEQFSKLSIKDMWFGADSKKAVEQLPFIMHRLQSWKLRAKRCYVLVGFARDTLRLAERRLFQVLQAGCMPFAQFYRGPGEQLRTQEWHALVRKWSRPAAYLSSKKELVMKRKKGQA